MCDAMKKYKDTHLKLANDEKVDIIYSSSKESTILKMPECGEDKELVNKDSSFFGLNLSFFIQFQGETSKVCKNVLKDGIIQNLNTKAPEIMFVRKSVFDILKNKLGIYSYSLLFISN